MILFVSGRCDIVAFYSEWFKERYEEGYVDVRNPFNPKAVSRIFFEHADMIVFCTKNPSPILDFLPQIRQPILFHVTLTPYHDEIEPFVKDKHEIIKDIQRLSKILSKEQIYVRYDPIFISEKYTFDYRIRAFTRLCEQLDGFVSHIIVSFMDEYKNVQKNKDVLKHQQMNHEEMKTLLVCLAHIAHLHHMTLQTCAENIEIETEGFIKESCVSKRLAFEITNKKYKKWQARQCGCVEMADIGVYNSCGHYCKYCYANYDESQIEKNRKKHDVHSSLLIGTLHEDDQIKERK